MPRRGIRASLTASGVDGGPIGVGSRYHLAVRMAGRLAPMAYTVTEYDPQRRVVLHGSGSGVEAEDAIDFGADAGRTVIEYTATIRLVGIRRLAEPFLGGTFRRIARDARDGMQAALDRRVAMTVPSSAVPSPVARSNEATRAAT